MVYETIMKLVNSTVTVTTQQLHYLNYRRYKDVTASNLMPLKHCLGNTYGKSLVKT